MNDELKIIHGLSLTRPWPFAFVNGPEPLQKRVENRSWKPPQSIVGNHLALHAAKSWSEDGREFIADVLGIEVPNNADSPHSQIFAVCRVTGYVEDTSDDRLTPEQRGWFFGPYGWLLDDFVKLVDPVPCTGAMGLWGFDKKQEALEALRTSYKKSL
jgi:hypothetical protein